MSKRKLSLTRETILPLSSTDLDAVVGGVAPSGCFPEPSGLSRTVSRVTTITGGPNPNPRPSIGTSIGTFTSGGTSIRGGQVSGQSNAF